MNAKAPRRSRNAARHLALKAAVTACVLGGDSAERVLELVKETAAKAERLRQTLQHAAKENGF